jgi:hypothetical protein
LGWTEFRISPRRGQGEKIGENKGLKGDQVMPINVNFKRKIGLEPPLI